MKNRLFVSMSLIAISSTAFADGGGYNGPDLNPVSIPVQLDRGISVNQVGSAIGICLLTGDSSRGLRSTLQSLGQQIGFTVLSTSFDVTSEENVLSFDTPDGPPINIIKFDGGADVKLKWNNHKVSDASVLYEDANANVDSLFFFNLLFTSPGTSDWSQSTGLSTSSKFSFPFVSYDKILSDTKYDDFGNAIPNSKIISGLKINVASDFETIGAAMPLLNSDTGILTKFTINEQEYVQCLQSEIQYQVSHGAQK